MTVDPPSELLTRSAEDYLKAIYRLSRGGSPATTNELAQALELAPASVSGMVKRLAEQGLVDHEPYRGAVLSEAGRRIALRIVRRHRMIEAYLVGFLGYTWDTVHEEAERLEHAVSDMLIERMARALGNPAVDPHGDPIPAADGSMAELVYIPLSDLGAGEEAEMRQVTTSQPERLRYLAASGLVPGAQVRVVTRGPFNGPITIRVGEGELVLGPELAGQVMCARLA